MKYAIFQMRKEQREESPALLICYVDMLVGWKKRHSEKTKESWIIYSKEKKNSSLMRTLYQKKKNFQDWKIVFQVKKYI